jgi:hypothetical protein
MMMKCPVCGESCDSQVGKCPECGFNQLHREFLNEEELNQWIKETVEPCEAVADHLLGEINILLKRENELLKNHMVLRMRLAAMRIIHNAEIEGRRRETSGFLYGGELWVCDGFRVIHFNSYYETFPDIEDIDGDKGIIRNFKLMRKKILSDELIASDIDRQIEAPSRSELKELLSLGKETYSFGIGKPLVSTQYLLDMVEALPDSKLLYDKDALMIHFSSNMGEGILLGIKPKNDE